MFKKISRLFKQKQSREKASQMSQREFRIPSQAEFQTGASYKNFTHLKDTRLYEDNEYALNFLKNHAQKEINFEVVRQNPAAAINLESKSTQNSNLAINLESKNAQNPNLAINSANDSSKASAKTKFHAYWYGVINEKHTLSMKSLLATQKNAELCLWLDEATYAANTQNPYLQALKRYIYIYICMRQNAR